MRKVGAIIIVLLGLNISHCKAQSTASGTAAKFFAFVNDYQVDSLQELLSEDFQLKRTYINYANDKKSFIENYIPNSRNVNGKFQILSTQNDESGTVFLVEDQSDYLKLLKVDFPQWKIQITVNDSGKIERTTIDTTDSYQSYLRQVQENGAKFEEWIQQKYPTEFNATFHSDPDLLMRRLREYAGEEGH